MSAEGSLPSCFYSGWETKELVATCPESFKPKPHRLGSIVTCIGWFKVKTNFQEQKIFASHFFPPTHFFLHRRGTFAVFLVPRALASAPLSFGNWVFQHLLIFKVAINHPWQARSGYKLEHGRVNPVLHLWCAWHFFSMVYEADWCKQDTPEPRRQPGLERPGI